MKFAFHLRLQLNFLYRIPRSRDRVVKDFTSIINLILIFRDTLITLHLVLLHQDPNVKHSLTYIDGNDFFSKIVVHMKMMREFSFWIETACLCNQQMNNIIRSFQTGTYLAIYNQYSKRITKSVLCFCMTTLV